MRRWRLPRAVFLVALAIPPTVQAQYFGQNKVQHRNLEFAVLETEHFEIYYYEDEREAAIDGARMAERAYGRLSRILGHRYRERQPLVFFASHTEFQQNNVTTIGETTGGVTEPYRHRALLPFTGSYADFEHVLQHELVHQFQFDVFARGVVGAGIQQLVAVNPPLWFMEGMAEYLSLGPIDTQTAMWVRAALVADDLPTIEQLTTDTRYTPYRFGHALWSYIGERWGDEAVSRILHSASVSGVETAMTRVLGRSLRDLSTEWHDAIRHAYLPLVGNRRHARDFATPMLTEGRSSGTVHLSPALSPDGGRVVYLSEGSSFWIDLYLMDAAAGMPARRLVKSAFSADFESLRFLNSAAAWSPDGRLIAFVAKRGGADDLVIFDTRRMRIHRRIAVPLNGLTTPSWSPDGKRLAFTGYDGGLSDLYTIEKDGSGLRRLTNDRYADLHPAWSPDGRSIAFATDRGPQSDLATLRLEPLRLAIYDLETGSIKLLEGMEGRNINPQWSPDGESVAFVSDRTGVPNIFLYERAQGLVYQLTDVYTGIAGVTPLSPAISWAPKADRLALTQYENGKFNVYAVDNPRRLKREPYDATQDRSVVSTLTPPGTGSVSMPLPVGSAAPARVHRNTRIGHVLRAAPGSRDSARHTRRPYLSVRRLLDSAALALPDTSEFNFRPYSARLIPDYVVQPSIGYVRDNFGGGIFGGSAVALSDMLGNRRLFVGAQVNGRLEEALISAAYSNLRSRTNWAVGLSQDPRFYYTGSEVARDETGGATLTTRLERFIVRQAFVRAHRPFNRFHRVEIGLSVHNVSRDAIDFVQPFDPTTGIVLNIDRNAEHLETANFLQPVVAVVFDNSVSTGFGPFIGRRSRLEYSPAIGDWSYHQVLGDYRRYDHLGGFFTIATRALFFGRFGAESGQFPLFLGMPELLRGYTAGSFRRHECLTDETGPVSGCGALDQLIGSRIAVANAELRFPLIDGLELGALPLRLPPIQGAVFFDVGLAWRDESVLVLGRNERQNRAKDRYRTPLTSMGVSLRTFFLGFLVLRGDFAKPLTRSEHGAYWTLSIGPTF